MSGEDLERLVAEIPGELKQLVDADRRNNKEVVKAALWREFGGERKGVLERRIEEKERRISIIKEEKKERETEIQQERQELQALKEKYSEQKDDKQKEIETAAKVLDVTELKSTGVYVADSDEHIKQEAERVGCTPEKLKEVAIQMYKGEYDE